MPRVTDGRIRRGEKKKKSLSDVSEFCGWRMKDFWL